MANRPDSFHHNTVEFRAPPPSPIASGRRSSFANDEFLTEFLHHSLRVPDLVLPDRLSPRQNSKIQNIPKLDYKSQDSTEGHLITEKFDVIARTGCFVQSTCSLRFRLRRRNIRVVTGEEGCYDEIRQNLEIFTSEIEKICGIILKILLQNTPGITVFDDDKASEKETAGSVCYFYRHRQDPNAITTENYSTNSLRYDMIRMLIRGSEHSHTLGLHVCNGSEFHVYSKKGWVSFCPEKDALVITIGDHL
ncbi:hypothetical protein L1987_31537 [Smallanthus sonchifolius]|uniref:Uncharacterized protein n=1 Tax=Smallanthus sonchifolius TaxID=185202 RepID=A0ACB9I792_9ASTR|nr:hypothetical protein L1987_31537 [Smallanthus sonchifolius]